jgi:signal peptidase I
MTTLSRKSSFPSRKSAIMSLEVWGIRPRALRAIALTIPALFENVDLLQPIRFQLVASLAFDGNDMTAPETSARRSSPLRSVWSNPRDTIDRVLAANPGQHVLLLAILGTTSRALVWLVAESGSTSVLLDWRIILAAILFGVVAGILGIYIGAFLFKWTAKPLGGHASMTAIRAALAWASVPYALGVPICLVILIGLALAGFAGTSALIVFQLIVAALILWALILFLIMYRGVQNFGYWRAIANFIFASILTLVVPFTIRTFFFQPFQIPSRSMMPTLLVGDNFFVSKSSYGYTRYSLPFSPRLFSGRVFASEPQRGDVAVFRVPKGDSVDYVKRIVGLPGDRIQMINGVLQINGQPVKHEHVEDFVGDDGVRVKRYRETLPNGVAYATLDLTDNGFYDNTQVYAVPPGHYFMLGDNRDNSTDSRVLSAIGYVPFENLIGRVELIFFSIIPAANDVPATIRYDRIGTVVR